jgi:cytochrome c-type biogenesis protein
MWTRCAAIVSIVLAASLPGERLAAQSSSISDAGSHPATDHAAMHHGGAPAASLGGSASYLTLNVQVSDTDVQPSAAFVPVGRPVQLMLRNRGSVEHHYRVAGLVPDDLMWIARATAQSVTAVDDDHSNHHGRQTLRSRAPSPAGIRPTGHEVHAYVTVPGEIDIVLFTARQTGRFNVVCDLHRDTLGTLAVFDPSSPAPDTEVSASAGPALVRALTKDLGSVDYPDAPGVQVEATYATAEYVMQALGGAAATASLEPARYIGFLLTERTHSSSLPKRPETAELYVNGRLAPWVDARVMTDSVHHRATFYRFIRDVTFGSGHQMMTLRLASGPEATWHLPLIVPATAGVPGGAIGLGEQWGLILALLGGMVAAMWPCLFQLTVYFIPALAGVAMQEVNDVSARGRRRQVLVAAFYFILGFTLVYTATGALIGYAAQRLGGTTQFETWQRYFGMAAGVIVIGLALRVAAKVRAPLICRMPLLSRMTQSQKPATRLEMMLAGLAFATGCMTCFGSALVVGMVVYVGLAQSALYGALVLFLFSLGMGIPLVAAALAMARALPLLTKLETAMPWMGLASALLMAGFGVLLLSGNYMLVSEWTFRVVSGSTSLPPGSNNVALAVAVTMSTVCVGWLIWRLRNASPPSTESM